MFWRPPELVQGLLPFLNLESTLRLAQAHQKTRSILQGSRAWNSLIKRNYLLDQPDKATHLVDILKLMEDTESNQLDLLDTICEASPSNRQGGSVQIRSSRHPDSHSISVEGFLLLEKVEAAFGTTEQTVRSIGFWLFVNGPLLSALASRLSRQQQKLTTFYIGTIGLSSNEEAEDFKILMQACPPMTISISQLNVENIGTEGWGQLAEGLQSHPGLFNSALVQKSSLDTSTKADLRVLWDTLRPHGFLVVEERATEPWSEISEVQERFEKVDGETAWIRLCQVKDLDMMEWIDERLAEMLEPDEEEEEDEGEEEGEEYEEGEEEEDEAEDEGDEEVGAEDEEAQEQGIESQGDEGEDA